MNLYMLVEGKKTETSVYPAWLAILAPHLKRVDNPKEITENCYYLFSGEGIPSIYNHACNAILDIQQINKGEHKYDYLLICLDTEEGTRADIDRDYNAYLSKNSVNPQGVNVVICEHQVCMESWFLGNRFIFKQNANTPDFLDCVHNYNVSIDNPELMPSFDKEKNKAEYHYYYLRKMLEERNMRYKKTKTDEVQKPEYLNQLIARYDDTKHISSFGRWYEFIKKEFLNIFSSDTCFFISSIFG